MKTILSAALLATGAMLATLGSASAVPADGAAIARAAAPATVLVAHQYGIRAGCAQGQKRNRYGNCRAAPSQRF
jgi:hypothetical protein